MESVLFGKPLTHDVLVTLPQFQGRQISQRDRAQHALDTMNEDKKYEALEFMKDLKKDYGVGASTLGIFYNATGDVLTLERKRNWYGHIQRYTYPPQVGNGQWGAFLHIHRSSSGTGSIGAIVYRGKNESRKDIDWMQAWYTPSSETNRAYTEVQKAGYFTDGVWDGIYDNLSNTTDNNTYSSNGGQSSVGIGDDTSPFFEGVMTLEGLEIPKSK